MTDTDIAAALQRAAGAREDAWYHHESTKDLAYADARLLRELAAVLDGDISVDGVNLRDVVIRALAID